MRTTYSTRLANLAQLVLIAPPRLIHLLDTACFERRRRRFLPGPAAERPWLAPERREIVPSSKAQPDGTLLKALARAWRWQRMLDDGVYSSVTEISTAEGINKSYVSRILRLALLSPDIIEMVLEGRSDEALMLEQLERPLPASWEEQRKQLS